MQLLYPAYDVLLKDTANCRYTSSHHHINFVVASAEQAVGYIILPPQD